MSFLRVSHCENTKEIWDILQITHEGTTEVKRERLSILTHEYELFIVKLKERIYHMQTRFTHIVSHMRTMGKTFSNEEFLIIIIRFLNHSWKSKVIAICEYNNLATMD